MKGFLLIASSLVLLTAAPARSAVAPDWYHYQRARYQNAPLLKQAALAEARGDYAAAREALDKAAARTPNDSALLWRQISVYKQTGDWSRLLEGSERLLQAEPGRVDLLCLKGKAAYELGNMALAARALRLAFDALPATSRRRTDLLPLLTRATRATGDIGDAAGYARAWAQTEPAPDAYALLVQDAVARKDWPAAAQWANQGVAVAEDAATRSELLLQLGYLRTRTGDLDGAAEAFAGVVRDAPDPARRREARRQQGQIAYRQGHYDEAARHFKIYLLESFDENAALGYLSALDLSGQEALASLEAASFLEQNEGSTEFKAAVAASWPSARP